jgi:hypothetical protein
MLRAIRGAAATPRPVPRSAALAVLTGMAMLAAGCGGGGGGSAAPVVPAVARATGDLLTRSAGLPRLLERQGVSLASARSVRLGTLPNQAWVAAGSRTSCVLTEVPGGQEAEPTVAVQCGPRERRRRLGLVATMGASGVAAADSAAVYGLAPKGARKAIVSGQRRQVVDVEDGVFGVVAEAPRYVQFSTPQGLTPKVVAAVPGS